MGVKYTNNAKTTISSGINNSVTTIPVASSSGFPSLSGSDYFYATLDDATNIEVVKVTAVSGTNWTVVRAQDDTTARAFDSGDDIELRLNAALLTDVVNDAMSDAFTRQAFTGDGSETDFTLSKAPATENDLIVFIEGVFQTQSAYSVSGTTLTFSAAPANSREIIVYNITAAVNGDSLSQNNFTGDGSDTTFTLGTDPLHENNTMVFLDGVYQHKSTYSVSGTTLTFSTAPASGVAIECITHTQTEVNTPASNSVVTASIVDDNVTQAKIADDAIGADQLAASAVVTASIVDDNVTQAKIADDAVGADQLASSAVVTASIVDDAVTTAKIADDQVTLAKMAGLARGKIIYGDSSGNPAALALGSNGQVLKSDGTDIAWGTDSTVAALTSEEVQDIVGAMFSSNTETGITATYQDGDGTVDLVIGDDTIVSSMLDTNISIAGTLGVAGTATFTGLVDAAIIDGVNFKVNGGQGSDGQVLTSTGSGVAWETPSSFNADAAQVFNESGAAVDFRIEGDTDANLFFLDGSADKIGIGTNAPTSKLHLENSASNAVVQIGFENDAQEWRLGVHGGLSDGFLLYDNTNSASRFFVGTDGKVGIGTTSPAGMLHVDGHTSSIASIFESNGNGDTVPVQLKVKANNGTTSTQGLYGNAGSASTDNTITLGTDGSTGLTVNNGGKVGIGETDPNEPLTIRSSAENVNTYLIEIGNDLHATNTKDAWIKYVGGAAQTDHSWATGIYSNTFRIVQLGARATAPDSGTNRMHILADGEVVFNSAISDTYAPLVNGVTGDAMVVGRHSTSGSLGLWRTNTMEFKYYHNGQGYIMTFGTDGVIAGDFNDTSDVNLKENISSISDGTTVIKALRPVKFDWKASGKGNNQHGFIAQEVETVLPNAVTGNNYVENETGLPEDEPAGNGKNMNSNAVLAHAVKAIQELEARIKTLEDA